jgi:hypothetical protein
MKVTTFPVYRSILLLDIESSTSRRNPIKQQLRKQLYQLLDDSLAFAGVDEKHREKYEDRGDGVIALIQPADEIPRCHLISRAVPALAHALLDYNLSLPPEELMQRGMRLRVVVHAGEIHRDERGFFGEALDVACRLLDSRRFKRSLATSSDPLALLISEDFYWNTVHHEYDGLRACDFTRDIRVTVGGRAHYGWLKTPAPMLDSGIA